MNVRFKIDACELCTIQQLLHFKNYMSIFKLPDQGTSASEKGTNYLKGHL